ncbi:MAG: LD-carboxypeptidase [Lachnospiraceae bacterium]|nr:LD-carboxypeptidase [Lachnospiraceae bacterium]
MKPLQNHDKVALVCCSNGLSRQSENIIKSLCNALKSIGLEIVLSPFLYAGSSIFSGTAKERADILMGYYKDSSIKAIFDVSGGDLANEILPNIDFSIIKNSDKLFWGYSDLTTVINAIYKKTGKSSVLYQVRNLVYNHSQWQTKYFSDTIYGKGKPLFSPEFHFIRQPIDKEQIKGTLIGGNIRCLLKLAGTPYFPDTKNTILFLESRSGQVPQMVAFFSQLQQMGVLKHIKALLLGTFTEMEVKSNSPSIEELALFYVPSQIPIAKTSQIGHGTDSLGLIMGDEFIL